MCRKVLPMVVQPTLLCVLNFLAGIATRMRTEKVGNSFPTQIAFKARQSSMKSKHQQRASISLICINKAPTKIPSVNYELM